jgi:hypothetical protein
LPAIPVTVTTGTTTIGFTSHPMHTIDLSSVANLTNQPGAQIRICAWGATMSGGTWRIDNVRVTSP